MAMTATGSPAWERGSILQLPASRSPFRHLSNAGQGLGSGRGSRGDAAGLRLQHPRREARGRPDPAARLGWGSPAGTRSPPGPGSDPPAAARLQLGAASESLGAVSQAPRRPARPRAAPRGRSTSPSRPQPPPWPGQSPGRQLEGRAAAPP
ncbi:cuticle collagen 19-like [Artibeus jamaicensis]|uniref:cuticle collagen 19-like n=1 Tax=Artibeus jamaicensis TaxID=9417 RepID=UPI00235ADD7F|nr:cuticle collagen 19-like [Artibeus jamaicensis]